MSEDPNGRVRVAVDIGGTFTDIVLRRSDGSVRIKKIATTPREPGRAVLEGLRQLLAEGGTAPGEVAEIIHATTVGTNAVLERRGARTGLLTTRGFRDVLEIARIRTPVMFDLTWDKPAPLVERRHRLEVDERVDADGRVVRPVDVEGAKTAADRLVGEGVESIAICFINSYRNPRHEEEVEQALRERHPDVDLSVSCRVLPEIKEYERTSTVVVNAYVQPRLRRYLADLQRGLREAGVRAPLMMVASDGGVMSAGAAMERPVFFVASGPAAGVVGAADLARLTGDANVIAFDMGGTTAKASLVEGGEPTLTGEYEVRAGISTPSRFIKAGGYLLKVPAVDIAEVGSGGGSIAWIDRGGALRVGPRSAGADPGPVCYGSGGEEPTVTDANLVLGYLNPEHLVGGALGLDAEKARRAIRRRIAEPLGLTVLDAAFGVRAVANATMVRAVRAVTLERGRDPRDFRLFAFGGGGPAHAADVAGELGIRRIVVPPFPGVFTAAGMLSCDVRHHVSRTLMGSVRHLDPGETGAVLAGLRQEVLSTLRAEGYDERQAELRCFADLRYLGQSSELTVPLPEAGGAPASASLSAAEEGFRSEYGRTYGYTTGEPVELVALRVVATVARGGAVWSGGASAGGPIREGAGGRSRAAYFGPEVGRRDVRVLDREALGAVPVEGPAIVESYDSTILVPSGWRAAVDGFLSVVIERCGDSPSGSRAGTGRGAMPSRGVAP